MVFTSFIRYGLNRKGGPRGPDRFWRRRKILRMSAHFFGRKRNCYRIAINYVEKSWQYLTRSRSEKKITQRNLWTSRLTAACEEHGVPFETFRQGLLHLDVLLNKKVLTDLAVFEPRTFKSLANLSKKVAHEAGLNDINSLSDPPPPGVFTRNLLKE